MLKTAGGGQWGARIHCQSELPLSFRCRCSELIPFFAWCREKALSTTIDFDNNKVGGHNWSTPPILATSVLMNKQQLSRFLFSARLCTLYNNRSASSVARACRRVANKRSLTVRALNNMWISSAIINVNAFSRICALQLILKAAGCYIILTCSG